MVGIVRIPYCLCELGCNLIPVKERCLRAFCRVDYIPLGSVAGLVLIPEAVSFLEPVRVDGCREQHGVEFFLGEFLSLKIFRQPLLGVCMG